MQTAHMRTARMRTTRTRTVRIRTAQFFTMATKGGPYEDVPSAAEASQVEKRLSPSHQPLSLTHREGL